ncbi:dihydroorotase [Paucilactobacillus hokkaidonensis JCM 18461]|uniref:Dihydroorotase n=2 Tax=Paucilactobacillus hokkaidonensis TaxID=1193095 RepID=A0A0A1H0D5_9LACO|nr:dihydroorotase [Paucilactobacillus hokkaidonensis]KRO10406.1 dihydroorotase [Paucilactobacillus hokkaidonensis]BAP86723.1 dihydroorotase [Paucilactobacillus hokkaidonensis JCM 18461]
MSLLLKNGFGYLAGKFQDLNVLIENGRVESLNQATTADNIIDLQHALITPGLIDVHVHLREPGFTNKETIKTGSSAAAHGGFTTIGAMANLNPVPDNAQQFSQQIKLNQSGAVKIKQYAPVTKQRQGQACVNFGELKNAGAFAFSDDGSGIDNARVMFETMQQLAHLHMPLCDHAQDMNLTNAGVINAGPTAQKLGVPGVNNVSETAQIARNLVLAQATGVHYHVCHVSTKESIELIRIAKANGINVTCEVTPHHLLLDDTDIVEDNAQFKMNPPLRSQEDRLACVAGLMDGTIDLIATDHAPHTDREKQLGLLESPNGIVGSETAFALLYTKFVKTGIWPLENLIEWMSGAAKRIFKLTNVGQLKIGDPADVAVFDLEHAATIDAGQFLSKGHNSPFIGQQVYGMTVLTLVNGQVVYRRK